MMSDTPKNKDLTEFIAILGTLIIIFCIWSSYPRILTAMDEPTPPAKVTIPYKLPAVPEQTENSDKTKFENVGEKYGTYGDSYGSLNTLFSGLAFAVLIISLFMQRQELKAQREELAAQRGELTAQRKEAEQSNKIAEGQRKITEQQATLIKQQIDEAKVQNFYSVLFEYLHNLDQLRSEIAIYNTEKGGTLKSEIALASISSFFVQAFQVYSYPEIDNDINAVTSLLNSSYEDYSHSIRFDLRLSLFYDNLIMILRFIDEDESIKNKQSIINTLLSHLSSFAILSLTWIAIIDDKELKSFIEKYGLLRNFKNHIAFDNFKLYFAKSAFEKFNE